MKRIILALIIMCGTNAIAQKVDVVTYEQLTNPDKAKFISKKIKFKGVQMPDGAIYRVGDILKIGDRNGENQRKYKMAMEDVYSTLKYGTSFTAATGVYEFTDDRDPQYMFAVDKGKMVQIYKFNVQKKLDETFFVEIIIKPAEGNELTGEWNRGRASLESFELGELVKI